jgi:transposase
MAEQEVLLELPEQPERGTPKTNGPPAEKKLRYIDRNQLAMLTVDVERLIDEQHPARGIWDATAQLDLSRFENAIKSSEGSAGRAAWPPHLLVAVWLYGYSRGISSARELERQMGYEPGLMWLCGLQVINHHTLSDFRVDHQVALTKLFSEMLLVLDRAGLVKLHLAAHDGTKIRAQAGVDSFRREATIKEKLERIRQVVEEDPKADGGGNKREQAARERAKRERIERAEAALKELAELQSEIEPEEKKTRARVSMTEPESRWMKHGDKAIAPSYNAQISTDADSGVIVGAQLTQSPDDAHQLQPAIETIQKTAGRMPEQIVADGGYTNRATIQQMADAKVDFYGSLADPKERSEAAMKSHGIDPKYAPHFFILQPETRTAMCPAGKTMKYLRINKKRGDTYETYRANAADCMACVHRMQCCPKTAEKGRIVSFKGKEKEVIAAFRKKMASQEGKATYARRGPAAEFPFAGIKERMRLRKFRLFGMAKAGMELIWACLAYNVMLWLRAKRAAAAAAAASASKLALVA